MYLGKNLSGRSSKVWIVADATTSGKFPDEFSVDEIIDELLLLEKIDRGLAQSSAGDVIADEGLDKELPEWLR
ncbi:hypothetical protein LVD15_25435 [Fulvivirga maritima]|uniref:hypothetical protein n=1 Tax=Fulvivirga maritima TaxID=2904247 RepID=UPI001F3A71C7|nr:hypothetical protein [Fulvivirga maritima]UII26599.1 hypothetical protein LVD15_25435 [Fulvivirga maritima]